MKKRVLAVLLAGSMLAGLCGCNQNGGGNNSSTAESGNTSSENVSQVQANPSSEDDNYGLPQGDRELIDSWGFGYDPRTEEANYFINCPSVGMDNLHSTIPDEGYSFLMEERDPYGQIAKDAAKTIEEIMPTYEELIFLSLKGAEEYAHTVKNQKITVDSTENIKVNEYEICVKKGTYSCDIDSSKEKTSKEYPYVCYATFLTTGTPVFWVLIDRSEDKSKGADMEEAAMNMAKTLREYNPDDKMSRNKAWGNPNDGLSKD